MYAFEKLNKRQESFFPRFSIFYCLNWEKIFESAEIKWDVILHYISHAIYQLHFQNSILFEKNDKIGRI